MHHLKLVIFFLCSTLSFNSSHAEQSIDVRGIYQSADGSKNYVTINRQGNKYILINITRETDLLNKLLILNDDEVETLSPTIEEFAFSFSTPESGVELGDPISLKLIIPFPGRTTELTDPIRFFSVVFGMDDMNGFSLHFFTDGAFINPTGKLYKKIF